MGQGGQGGERQAGVGRLLSRWRATSAFTRVFDALWASGQREHLSGSFDNLTAGSASAPGRFSFNGLLRTARKTKATAQPGGEGTDWRVQGHAAAQSQRGCRHGVPGDARLHICSIPDNQRFPQSSDAPIPRLSSRAMQTCGMAQGNADKYQAYAEECMQLIKRMPSDARPTLLRIAEAWLELALSELKRDMHPDNLQPRSTDKMQ